MANGILNPPKGIGGREGLKPSPTLIDVFAVVVCRFCCGRLPAFLSAG
jgi:hypothetical protein